MVELLADRFLFTPSLSTEQARFIEIEREAR